MTRDEVLKNLANSNLVDRQVRIVHADEASGLYTLKKAAKPGATSMTFKAIDRLGFAYAIKFVPKLDYVGHSVEAEFTRARKLSKRFSQIRWYGEPHFTDPDLANITQECYAIVTEWVDGLSFADFVRTEGESLEVSEFLEILKDFCEILAHLAKNQLIHNDLHGENLIVAEESTGPRLQRHRVITVIDLGSLKTTDRHRDLIEKWQTDISALQQLLTGQESAIHKRIEQLESWIDWFSRTDQEWVVFHLCSLVNQMRRRECKLPMLQRRFLEEITPILNKMVDSDPQMRLSDAVAMYDDIELLWKKLNTPSSPKMMGPFDLISAELIRSDVQLNLLFSEKAPWFDKCSTTDPVYIYGPRGCGKSTILRRLSLPAVLSTEDAEKHFGRIPYIGVYLSCSSELRSRFWLFPNDEYPNIEGDAVLFFIMLLTESLLDTLEFLRDGNCEKRLGRSVGLTNEAAAKIAQIIFASFDIPGIDLKLGGVSWLVFAKKRLSIKRQEVWKRILTSPSKTKPNPALLFDICKAMEEVLPLLREKHIAFLLDDYSNQRIPVELQRRLNQTISFAKQGNPIFKVSSEYFGVDLEGIQEGREVIEVNFGLEYVELNDRQRGTFLEDVLNIRFRQNKIPTTIDGLLGRSNLSPGLPLARAIREAHDQKKPFHYHGIDTIADICSGDVAMALDLVKQIYETVKETLPLRSPVTKSQQHEVIRRYTDREHMYVRYYANHGKAMSRIVEALCRLAHQCVCEHVSEKDGVAEPMIKTHLDIQLNAVNELPEEWRELLLEMQKRGVLFSLDTSRSRLQKNGTERFQVRRILLAKTVSPLGRKDPIKLDHVQRLLFLLQEPEAFVQEEFDKQQRLKI